jgi:hypothetical protein
MGGESGFEWEEELEEEWKAALWRHWRGEMEMGALVELEFDTQSSSGSGERSRLGSFADLIFSGVRPMMWAAALASISDVWSVVMQLAGDSTEWARYVDRRKKERRERESG